MEMLWREPAGFPRNYTAANQLGASGHQPDDGPPLRWHARPAHGEAQPKLSACIFGYESTLGPALNQDRNHLGSCRLGDPASASSPPLRTTGKQLETRCSHRACHPRTTSIHIYVSFHVPPARKHDPAKRRQIVNAGWHGDRVPRLDVVARQHLRGSVIEPTLFSLRRCRCRD